ILHHGSFLPTYGGRRWGLLLDFFLESDPTVSAEILVMPLFRRWIVFLKRRSVTFVSCSYGRAAWWCPIGIRIWKFTTQSTRWYRKNRPPAKGTAQGSASDGKWNCR